MERQRIPVHERIAVIFFISVLLFIAMTNCIVNKRESSLYPQESNEQIFSVTLSGCVERPGLYSVKGGSCLKEVVAMAVPIESADLSKLKLNRIVKDDMIVDVPAKKIAGKAKRGKRMDGEVE